jgi:flagellar hook-associated protein 3 FlgL
VRTTFNSISRHVLADLSSAAERLSEAQRQVSSGRRVEQPSHDPSGMRRIVQEGAEIGTLDQYIRASDSVGARLTVVDSVLSDIIDHITAARSAASGALGSQTTDAQRDAIASGIEAHRDAIVDSFSSRFRGAFLFAGAEPGTAPYEMLPGGSVSAYQGSTTTLAVDINRVRSVDVGLNGDTIARGTDTDDVFVVFEELIDAVRAGDSTGINEGLVALERAFDRANRAQSKVGADLQAIDATREGLEMQRRASAARQADVRDANLPEAITAMAEADTAYRAALGATSNVTRVSLMDFLR